MGKRYIILILSKDFETTFCMKFLLEKLSSFVVEIIKRKDSQRQLGWRERIHMRMICEICDF